MTDVMRIALVTGNLSRNAGGLSVSVPLMAYGLDTFADVETHVFGTQDPASQKLSMNWGPRVHSFPAGWPNALQRAPRLASGVASLNPDVLDVQGLWTWASRVSLSHWQKTKVPYIVTPRGMLDPWALSQSKWKKKLFSLYLENEHLKNASCLRATAEMEAEHFRRLGVRSPIAVVPNAIEIPELRPKSHVANRRRVLFLSRIHRKKGVEHLLSSWLSLHASFPDWELVIAGIDEGGYESELKSLVEEWRVPRVIFPGPVFDDKKQHLYRTSDLFVLPTHSENFGLVVAEALSNEIPVITTKNAPWEGVIRNRCGWWIDLEPDKLTKTMQSAMSLHPDKRVAMGKRGREWVQREYGISEVAARMRELYFWVAGRGQKPKFVEG